MKCLFLAPKRYPFIHSIESGIRANGMEVKTVDYEDFFSKRVNKFVKRFVSLPNKMKTWEKPYRRKTNEGYLQMVNEYKPDVVLIYNNQLAEPEFLEKIKGRTKIAFILGDHPLYTHTSLTNLHILFSSDYTICPDSFWQEQLARMGIRNVVLDFLGFSEDVYHKLELTDEEREKHRSELIFIGNVSKINWGYKRIMFLNLFKDYDLKAYLSGGGGAERWLSYFPELRKRVIVHQRFDPAFNNLVYNCSKIAPMEQVPSLFNGIHARVFDALGAGVLPLCEYSADMERIFAGIDVPMIRDYREVPELCDYWLKDDATRVSVVEKMRAVAIANYSTDAMVRRMIDHLFMGKRNETEIVSRVFTS